MHKSYLLRKWLGFNNTKENAKDFIKTGYDIIRGCKSKVHVEENHHSRDIGIIFWVMFI